MSRADLHNAFVMDAEIHQASQVDASLFDPVVRLAGGLPGRTLPVAVVRDYQGPQGAYVERFTISDAAGRQVYASAVNRIELRGEAFEDRVVTVVRDLHLHRGGEHRATFHVEDTEVGSVPVFVEANEGGDPLVAAAETFKKALAKGAVVWISLPAQPSAGTRRRRGRRAAGTDQHTQPVWYVIDGDKVYVFSGPTEQEVPGLPEAPTVTLTARSKDLRSRVAEVDATVRVIAPDDPLFDKIGQAGLGRRLNLPDGEAALERWRANCALVELTPQFRAAEPAA
jgi:hypothetical protein